MVSSTFSLSAGSLMLALLSSPVAAASYSLVENWQGEHFLDYFNFHVGTDPTNGFVNYLDKHSAESAGLVKVTDSGSVYLGVDHVTKLNPNGKKGRDSVRIGSKKYYDKSLVIADLAHMPGSVCGTWPAFWSVGRNWPGDGEIDIIEGVNLQDYNEIVMHTAGTCSLTDTDMTGVVNATGCGTDLGTVGCVIEGHKGSYGTSFNEQKGGVYALEWTDDFLKIWYFPRHSIPPSITSGKPDVTQFGTPMALVEESCDIANAFKAQSFVFDVTFCGDWAGGVYGNSGCPMTGGDSFQSCHNYVANNPAQFEQSYWEINSVKIYQTSVKGINSPASSKTQAAPVVPQTHTQVHEQTHAQTHTQAHTQAHAQTHTQAHTQADEQTHAETHAQTHAQTHEETHVVSTATAVYTAAANQGESVGTVQELNPTTAPPPAATAKPHGTEAAEQPASPKKTRTVTSLVTFTQTVCSDAEQPSASAGHASVDPLGASRPHSTQVPTDTQDSESHTSWHTATSVASVPAANPLPTPETQSESVIGSTAEVAEPIPATAESLGAEWLHPSRYLAAVVSSVPYETSRALIPAPTGVSPGTATSATSGFFVPSGSQSGDGPVFTGAADRLSLSISALFFAVIVAALA
ncbi:MLG1 [Penicillium paradoxum]|uniref:MLG1 1,3(4)-beta-D-glucanase n=1 Tax=Penicillium paradoxum TaxID=176176 RepID=UPI0025481F2B|nr:MLG1 1,3(4)-beta-D-glucanase [Penicillium paradoxum]KAJ5773780.1 MLG1 [Penicillium paradoxum]